MQVSIESDGTLGRTVRVEVPEERIATEVESRLKSLSRTTKIQGFRPGKVPYKLIRQRFGTQVRQEVIGEVVQSSFYEAITQENLRPAGTPEIGPLDSEAGKGLVYTAKFEILPEIELADVGKLEIDRPNCEIVEEDVDKMVDVLRQQRQALQEVTREAGNNDTLDIDFKGTIDGEPFEGGEANGFKVELGAKRLIEGFEDGLIGKKTGENVTLNLTFPDDYQVQDLAGKPVEFQITVNSVNEAVLPELNEEFFIEFGVKEGGLDAFREQIREHMERESKQALRNGLRDAIMKELLNANTIELPNTLVEQEKQRIKQQFEGNLKAQGLNVDDIKNTDDSLYTEQANRRVALQLILSELIKENDLKADPVKVRAKIESFAESYQDPSAMINWYYSDKNRLAEIEALALEDEVIDWVISKAKLKDVDLSFDECMNKGQTGSV